MGASFLALLAAAGYGAADFLGGMVVRRATTTGAVVVSQAAGLALLLLVAPLLPTAHVAVADVAWGAGAGLAGGVGVALLYHALALGPMSVVAPVTAVCAVLVPVVAGAAFGERLTTQAQSGIGLAIVAVWLLGREDRPPAASDGGWSLMGPQSRGLRIAAASGVAIGCFLVALERTRQEAGLWPLAVARVVSIGLFVVLALSTGRQKGVPGHVVPMAASCGALDMFANAIYLVAVRQGQLSIVATLASLYPASTVLLARVVLGERLSRAQLAGVAGAIGAVVLIVSGST